MNRFAVIGGTGLDSLAGLRVVREHTVDTPWGSPSHRIVEGNFAGADCLFLARHGVPHHIPPHRINYRANLWALKELGATRLLAVNAVGGIGENLTPGHLVIPDQLIDYTWGREHTFFDGHGEPLEHIDFTMPYCREMRLCLAECAQELDLDCAPAGTYGATQGPRLETAAEIRRLQNDGCDVVGMTGMPEAALAVELGLRYASICLVVNPAAGLSDQPITLASMRAVLEQGTELVGLLLSAFLQAQR